MMLVATYLEAYIYIYTYVYVQKQVYVCAYIYVNIWLYIRMLCWSRLSVGPKRAGLLHKAQYWFVQGPWYLLMSELITLLIVTLIGFM